MSRKKSELKAWTASGRELEEEEAEEVDMVSDEGKGEGGCFSFKNAWEISSASPPKL